MMLDSTQSVVCRSIGLSVVSGGVSAWRNVYGASAKSGREHREMREGFGRAFVVVARMVPPKGL